MGMQAVDLAIENGVDLDGTPIPQKMLDLYNRIMDEENKRQRSGVKTVSYTHLTLPTMMSV